MRDNGVALATVLSLIKVYEAPFGGSVTLLSMAPVIVLSIHRGIGPGLAAGFVHSVIQLILGLSNVGWVPDMGGKVLCVLFDYIIPFTLLGLGGMFRNVKFTKNDRTNLIVQALLGTLVVTRYPLSLPVVSGVPYGTLSTLNGTQTTPTTSLTSTAHGCSPLYTTVHSCSPR